jgi:outer membrane protein assembly factor BamB
MWRHDATHSGATTHPLPERLSLEWSRPLPLLAPWNADEDRERLDLDFEPVVLGRTLFLPSIRSGSLTALDTRTGAEKWTFYSDAPVRYPAAAWEGRVYFGSDDGTLYCVNAESGALVWKHRPGPRDWKVLGEERLMSVWPVRGAPVVDSGVVYFAAGLWPFMGTCIGALDARTGRVVFANEADGSMFLQQPHGADAFSGVSPQGPLAVQGERLFIPGGRSVPACYDRRSGNFLYFETAMNPRRGGSGVSVSGAHFFCGGTAFDASTGHFVAELGRSIVATPERLYYAGPARDVLDAAPPTRTGTPRPVWKKSPPGTVETPAKVECLIRAGARLYAGSRGRVAALENGKEVWRTEVEGTPATLVAADDRLFVVTREGVLAAYGAGTGPPSRPDRAVKSPGDVRVPDPALFPAEGYVLLWGPADLPLLRGLRSAPGRRVIALVPDPAAADAARRELAAEGIYGDRLWVLAGDPLSTSLPPYFAAAVSFPSNPEAEVLAKTFETLHPYGGRLLLGLSPERRGDLERRAAEAGLLGATVEVRSGTLSIRRDGGLPGSGDWTHEHADAANTRCSKDRRVKAPLGVLWFGGSAFDRSLPRHGHGPQPQTVRGKLIQEGTDSLRASDLYTGRLLWEAELPGVGDFFNTVVHQPGANASGSNFVSTSDAVYVAYREKCLRLDPDTGRIVAEFVLPGPRTTWGWIGVVDDVLLGGGDPVEDRRAPRVATGGFDDPSGGAEQLRKLLAQRDSDDSRSASRRIVAMNRHTGEVLWTVRAQAAFRHNAICAGGGKLFAIDRPSRADREDLRRRGIAADGAAQLVAWSLGDGRELWRVQDRVIGTWLAYSEERDLLVETGNESVDTLADEAHGMKARRGSDGSILWQRSYPGPPLLVGDTLVLGDRACDLRTGRPLKRTDPFTLGSERWTWTRGYGCSTPAASENLLTFRSGSAAYFDLARDGGTGNFGGFRSGCTNNLLIAGGLVSAPEYTRTCQCTYPVRTSLALVPMPEAEEWTYLGFTELKTPVRRIGVNLGAPGDRCADNGTVWLEHPSVGGPSPRAPVTLVPEIPVLFRKNPLRVGGAGLPWVTASGAKGLAELVLHLDPGGVEERACVVRLYFVEPDGLAAGQRVFDVALQGVPAITGFDVAREAGGADLGLVREFRDVPVRNDLRVRLTPRIGQTVLCGIEVQPECHLPRFRTALERWEADPYRILIRTSGSQDRPRALAAASALKKSPANVRVSLMEEGGTGGEVLLDVAPPVGHRPLTWRAPLEATPPEALTDSPVRRELVRRLGEGHAAVFLQMDSGEPSSDDLVAGAVTETLARLEKTLRLPALRETREDTPQAGRIPLSIRFSLLRVARNAPDERVLERLLPPDDPGSPERRGPRVFVVYGRGRVFSLPEATAAELERAASWLLAPSGAEGKGDARGTDLLLRADWPELLGMPSSKPSDVDAVEEISSSAAAGESGESDPAGRQPRSPALWFAIAAGVLCALAALQVWRRVSR